MYLVFFLEKRCSQICFESVCELEGRQSFIYCKRMKKRYVLIFLVLSLFINSCLYLDVKTPLDKDVRNTQLGEKVGRSKSHSVMWLVAWGDAGTAAAAKNGKIKTVSHLDVHYYSILFGLYSSRETIAYGN